MIYILLALPILLFLLLAYFGSTYLIARRKPDPAASPKDVGLDFEDVSFQSGDGLKLGGWYVPAIDSTRTIIVCSGANGSIDSDVDVLPWLHDAGFNVLMFDWRAHGRSAGSIVSLGYYERYDLIAAIELAKAKGAHKIGVLGFSMGGSIALSVAAAMPMIEAVAADSAFVDVVSAVKGGLIERLPLALGADTLAHLFLLTASLRLGIRGFGADPLSTIDRIAPRPLLLLYGDRDPYVPSIEIDQLIARAGTSAEVWRVPEAGHRNLHELRSHEYSAKIVAFFERNL
jgi:fermentation-respiration switch protein FrsA (DUF1100 family)